ncbi:EF-hand domain-containing protein [Burkholderia thailandensis]|uniref:EF-hand domain-containing protein n=1 Tax=Burkholderia thailandensis (strain ATCC 700388 / DSM 13276 / CCUG 48851 / CIP 106301 / E264) TaxID=271848 RepID=Q2SZC8_BURTA|nr:EF-hand domain-containing protein [Burkholderia thailandensis]ABC37944.1 conserved hypothetical protein [Burkholderia thailandensis E264]AHI71906.1 hypothetical protein BTQ_2756 [Burkholderia thailandensis 2002721723]AHI80483.1 hypothetical protein BTJ_2939 [Burkholderia thailandensis E444]AIC86583.1 hypothetical protein BTRA_1077 [Burkholderia thailandensis USAMRU Malaysia \
MKIQSSFAWSALVVAGLALFTQTAFSQQAASAAQPDRHAQAQLGDPYVPPAARKPTTGTQTSGAALHAQVVRKLQRQFAAADADNTGLTEAQAKAAGLGYVAKNFKQIDANHTGRVSFSDVQRYIQSQSATQK